MLICLQCVAFVMMHVAFLSAFSPSFNGLVLSDVGLWSRHSLSRIHHYTTRPDSSDGLYILLPINKMIQREILTIISTIQWNVLNFPALLFILWICLACALLLAVWLTDYLKSSVTGLSLIVISFCWLSFLICFLAFWKPNLIWARQFHSNIHNQNKNELRKRLSYYLLNINLLMSRF